MEKLINHIKTHISVKISLVFMLLMILIELFLFICFYIFIFNSTVNTEVNALQVRGDNYARVLSTHLNQEMVEHAIMLEDDSGHMIVIQDANGDILGCSDKINKEMKGHIQELEKQSSKTGVLHCYIFESQYIVTASPILNQGKLLGRVYLFLNTEPIRNTIWNFTGIFISLVVFTIIITIGLTLLLSRRITHPILQIQNAAEKISQGNLTAKFNINSQDEIGNLAKSMEKLARDLDTMQKDRNNFLASVSHELRTPLTLIKGYSDFVAKKNTSEKDRTEYCMIIREEIDRLTNLVESLMTLARLEKNNFNIIKSEEDISQLIQNIKSSIQVQLKTKNIDLFITGDCNFIANIDEQRISQVLINLLINAYKYSHNNSQITLHIERHKTNFSFIVSDKGEGIPEESLQHIFERFYRVDKSRTRETGGVGLGLSIVEGIVKLHGGTIAVHSKEKVGSKFVVTLPYC